MYDKTKVADIAGRLADRLGRLRTGILDSSLYGGSNQEMQKQELSRTASELVHGIRSGWKSQAVTGQAQKVEGQLQTAAATGLIGDKDLQQYLAMIDDIYAAVDQKN